MIEPIATHDPLTGVYNRKAFKDELRLRVPSKIGPRRPLLLAYIDLDGSRASTIAWPCCRLSVLTAFAASANSFMSEGQIAGRLGGDEFAIAIAVADHGEAIRTAQDLHIRLTAALSLTGYPVGCSVGALFIDVSDDRSAEQGSSRLSLGQARRPELPRSDLRIADRGRRRGRPLPHLVPVKPGLIREALPDRAGLSTAGITCSVHP